MPTETDKSLSCANGSPEHTVGQCLKLNCGSDRQEASLYLYEAWQLPDALTGGWRSDGRSLAELIPMCEVMATDVFAATPLDESACPADDGPMCSAYMKQIRELPRIRDLAATLFQAIP